MRFIMHLLQTVPDNIGMITFCDIMSQNDCACAKLSGDAFRSHFRSRLANTDVDRDSNVSIG